METSTKVLSVIVSLLVVIQGYQLVGDIEPTHYCKSRDLKMGCLRLSSTNKTCYNEDGGKRCTEGWKEIPEIYQITAPEHTDYKVSKAGWLCPPDKCYPNVN